MQLGLDPHGRYLRAPIVLSSHGIPNGHFWEDFDHLKRANSLINLVSPVGFEPTTP